MIISQPHLSHRLQVVPCSIEQANTFVQHLHRHHGGIPAARLAFAVADETGRVRGVALMGRPCNRASDDGWTLEVRRICTDGCFNACSLLYGAAWKAARAIGYQRLITYTLPEEGGASLRAVGWIPTVGCGGKPWNHHTRMRKDHPLFLLKKTRWEVCTPGYQTRTPIYFPFEEAQQVVQEVLL